MVDRSMGFRSDEIHMKIMVDWDFPGSDRTAPFTPAPDRDFITLSLDTIFDCDSYPPRLAFFSSMLFEAEMAWAIQPSFSGLDTTNFWPLRHAIVSCFGYSTFDYNGCTQMVHTP